MAPRTHLAHLFTIAIPLVSLASTVMPGCRDARTVNEATFTRAVSEYLQVHGELCLGKRAWPIDVSDGEMAARSRNGIQMPVLENLGLVTSHEASWEVPGEDGAPPAPRHGLRYTLTPEGEKSFLTRVETTGDGKTAPVKDLCAAKLTLEKVTRWELSELADDGKGHPTHAVVHYTYAATPADWAREPRAQRVFPAVARVLAGAKKDELTEGVTLTAKGWVADELLTASTSTTVPTNRITARAESRP